MSRQGDETGNWDERNYGKEVRRHAGESSPITRYQNKLMYSVHPVEEIARSVALGMKERHEISLCSVR